MPFYPIAKLGDFGLAITTHHKDHTNPHDHLGAGTPGYLAPVSVESPTGTLVADLFLRSKNETTLLTNIITPSPLIPTSGPLAQRCSSY